MAKSDGSVIIDTWMNTSGFQNGVANMKSGFSGLGSVVGKIGKVMAGVFAVQKLVQFGKEAIELGSDLAEVQNVVDVTFENLNGEINEFASNAIEQFGLSETSAKRFSSTMGAMLKSMGFTTREAADMGMELAGLAGDIASFYNLDAEEAFAKIRSGISGETEPLKQLGINLNVANLEQYALAQGITKSYSAMTQQEQALLRYNYLLSVTSDAQGDFARTSDSWANQTRILSENFNSLKATIGQGLINLFTPVLKMINSLISRLATLANSFKAFTELLTGNKAEDTASQYSSAAEGAENLADATFDTAEATEEAQKAQEGYLSGLDEMNRYTEPESSSGTASGAAASSGGSIGGAAVDYGSLAEGETAIDKFGGAVSRAAEKVKELAKLFADGFKLNFNAQDTFGSIESSIRGIGEQLEKIFGSPKVKKSLANFGKTVSSSLGKTAGSIAKVGATYAKNLFGGIEKFLSQDAGQISDFIASSLDFTAEYSELLATYTSDVAEVFSVFGSDTAQQVTANILSIFSTALMGTQTFAQDNALLIIDTLVTKFDENKERLSASLGGLMAGLETVTGSIRNLVGEITSVILPGLSAGFAGLLELLTPLTDFLIDIFFDAWNSYVNPALEDAGKVIDDVKKMLDQFWNDVCVPLGEFLGKVLTPVIETLEFVFRTLWENAIKPLADFVRDVLMAAWEALVSYVQNFLIPAWDKVISVFQWLWDHVLSPIVNFLIEKFKPAFQAVWESIKGTIEGIKETFTGLLNFIKDIFAGDWSGAWESIKEAFKGIWDSFENIVKVPLNGIIGFINALLGAVEKMINFMVDGINKLSFDVPDWVPVIGGETFGFDLDHVGPWEVPYLAKGAVIPPRAPFAAVLGDQRNGNNLEMPESLLRKIIREETGSSRGGAVYEFIAQLDRRTIFDEVIEEGRMISRTTGRNPFAL